MAPFHLLLLLPSLCTSSCTDIARRSWTVWIFIVKMGPPFHVEKHIPTQENSFALKTKFRRPHKDPVEASSLVPIAVHGADRCLQSGTETSNSALES